MSNEKLKILDWAKQIELFSGIQCSNIRELKKTNSLEEFKFARDRDKIYFKGFVNDLELML